MLFDDFDFFDILTLLTRCVYQGSRGQPVNKYEIKINRISYLLRVDHVTLDKHTIEFLIAPHGCNFTGTAEYTCERLAQGHYSATRRPGVKPVDLLIARPEP